MFGSPEEIRKKSHEANIRKLIDEFGSTYSEDHIRAVYESQRMTKESEAKILTFSPKFRYDEVKEILKAES